MKNQNTKHHKIKNLLREDIKKYIFSNRTLQKISHIDKNLLPYAKNLRHRYLAITKTKHLILPEGNILLDSYNLLGQ